MANDTKLLIAMTAETFQMASSSSSGQKTPPSPEEFKSAQKAGWNNVAIGWKSWWKTFEGGAQRLSDRLVDLAEIKPGDRVLDIATGIGEPAATAAKKVQPNGQVVATDISPEMLAIARERAKELQLEKIMVFEESDAETYPYPSSSFNAVISRWGLMFFPELVKTMQKVRNSLVQDGKLAVAVWSKADKTPMLIIPLRRASQTAGLPVPTAPGSLGPFRLADATMLENSLSQAGFRSIKTEKMDVTFSFNSIDDFIDFQKSVNGPVVAMLRNLPIEKQEETWRAMANDVIKYVDQDGAVRLDNEVIISVARR